MIFAIIAILVFATNAHAQHSLKMKTNPQVMTGTILSSDGRLVQFQTPAGSVGYPLANVESVTMPTPPELVAAQQAFQAKDFEKALQTAKGVAEKFKGLPTDWARLAASMVASIYGTLGQTDKAEAAWNDFEKAYPGAGGLQAKVGRAQIAAAKKDFLSAKDSLAPIVEEALKQKNVPRENAFAYSQAFYVMGLVNENEGKLSDALENYLRTVTIFFHDPSARAAAQDRADALRAKHKDKKTSEQLTVP
jgi:tetratricopeptide (TPR) repeat protein